MHSPVNGILQISTPALTKRYFTEAAATYTLSGVVEGAAHPFLAVLAHIGRSEGHVVFPPPRESGEDICTPLLSHFDVVDR